VKEKNHNNELIFAISFIGVLLATSIYYLINIDIEKLFRIGLTFITILGVYLLYIRTFLKGAKVIYYINMLFIFLSMYLASVLDFYSITNYDKFLHLLSGAIIAIIGYVLFLYLTNEKVRKEIHPLISVIFVILFATSAAAVWEIWEFTTDSLFGLKAQNGSLNDTMWDIICGTLVGVITSIPIYLYNKGKNIKFIKYIIEDIERNKK
jgi:CDP-diglyceride synthetase